MTGTPHEGRLALEKVGADLVEREEERQTRESLKIARVEARRDEAKAAIAQLETILAELWERIATAAPTTMVFNANKLQLEHARLEWDVVHDFVQESAFAHSGWDVFAGVHLRLVQSAPHNEYPGRSSSLWYARIPRSLGVRWIEVAYNAAEGNAPSEEPFALKDLIKADLVASEERSNLLHAMEPERIDGNGIDAFCDRWMGLLAHAAAGVLTRPERPEAAGDAAAGTFDPGRSGGSAGNPLISRLKRLGE